MSDDLYDRYRGALLGTLGRVDGSMLSTSKTRYREEHPRNAYYPDICLYAR